MLSKLIFTATAFSLSFSALAADVSREEATDRVVDQAAVDMQSEADAELARAARQFRGTAREAEMLMRLSELRLEIAEGLFRVAYGPKEKGLKNAYRAKLSSGVESLTRVIAVYSKSEYYPRALFLRGKAQKELGQSKAALKDFESFLSSYSNREESPVAALAVADISIQSQNFKRAVSVLAPLLSQPSLPAYPNALSKRAWAFFADSNPLAAVKELKLLAAHFTRLEQAKQLSTGDQALREALLADIPSIAYSAFSQDSAKFKLSQVNALLRSFDTGEGYRRMALRFMDHLRTSERDGELRTWKAIVLKSDPARAENLQMLIATFEYDLERESYADVVKTAGEMAGIISQNLSAEGADEARKLVVRAADGLTRRISDYRNHVKGNAAEKNLLPLLTVFESMTPAEDSRRVALRWNLAETYFGLENYENAAQAYRWVAMNWGSVKVTNAAVSPNSAYLKAISSRYESLRASGTIPKTLTAQASTRATRQISAAQMASLREWIQWMADYTKSEGASSLASFEFEANRALYQAGFQDEAMDRMKSNPTIASASLVIDTWIARARWDRVEAEAVAFSEMKGWSKPSFAAQMRAQAATAKFKSAEIAYATKNYSAAAEQASEFLKSYPTSSMAIDANGIACNSALNSGDLEEAVSCFDSLATRFPKTAAATQALRTAARIEDDRMNFASASDRYLRYLQANRRMSATESLTIRKRILQLARASGEVERMEKSSQSKNLCARLEGECELNRVLAALTSGKQNPTSALSKAFTARRELRAVWAVVALEQWSRMDRRSLDRAVGALVSNWKATDVSVRYFLIARVTKSLPAILLQERTLATRVAITASEKAITSRMRLLQNIETRAKIIGEIPVNAVQAAALETVYLGYSDLINDLRAMPTSPKATAAQKAEHNQLIAGMVHPLILKARKIRDSFVALDLKEKRGLDPDSVDGIWNTPVGREWEKAIQNGNWSRVAFLSNEVMDLKNVSVGWAKAARAISLATAGAVAEAKIIFDDACRNTTGSSSLREVCRAKGRG